MLETLKIKNIAIIDSAEIPFKSGLNILSGETGAGKSIVIESIALLLGGRASVDLIRGGCDEAQVEGLFDLSDLNWMRERLEKYGYSCKNSQLLVKRTVVRSGKHRIYINGELATLNILADVCDGLIDLCGQHEHQSLLRPSTQLELLDRYGGLEKQTFSFAEVFTEVRALENSLNQLKNMAHESRQRADFLRFQIGELKEADLIPGEDAKLQQEKTLLQSAETRATAANAIQSILDNEDDGALNALRTGLNRARALSQLDSKASAITEGLERALAELDEVSLQLGRYTDSVDVAPERLMEIQERLALLAGLRRKYGASAEEMLATLEKLENEFQTLENSDTRIQELEDKFSNSLKILEKSATALSQSRGKIARTFSETVTKELKDLKMGEARFTIELSLKTDRSTWTATGADTVQFSVQTNKGEAAKPLGKVASGGELSRLMLAIRRVISDRGGIGVYLFDEIDAGIGGQTAFEVGKKLRSVAKYNQVICITHLPQVASFADHHLSVRKQTEGKRTLTTVVELDTRSRKEELARMLGGPTLTKKSLENAGELLEMAK